MPRLRLKDQLALIVHRPLTIVSAPAGYGKSTTIGAWLEQQQGHRAWISLDEGDDYPAEFLAYFLAAIRRSVPSFGDALLPMIDGAGVLSMADFSRGFLAELDSLTQDVILVLDDFHVIRDDEILAFISESMRHPHPALHLVLMGRHDPLLPMVDWRARNQVVDIRAGGLRFGLDETTEFLGKATKKKLEDREVALLQTKTEGWPAALRLAALSYLNGAGTPLSVDELAAIDSDIMGYLASQVLSRLSPAKQSFLIQTSILERMSGPLCEAVISDEGLNVDGPAMLEELHRENMLLVSISYEAEWYRYHHLFRDFLRHQLTQQYSPKAINGLHTRASQWLADNGYIVEAIKHALTAGESDMAVNLVAENRNLLMEEDRWDRLESWYRLFPEQVVNISPDLLLIRAWSAHFRRFDLLAVAQITNQVSDILLRMDPKSTRARELAAENDVLCSLVDYFGLRPSTAAELCLSSLQVLPMRYYVVRSNAWLFLAASLQMQGDLAGALSMLQQATREDMAFPDSPRARSFVGIAFIHWIAGDLEALKQSGNNTLAIGSLAELPQSFVWGHYFLASAYYHQNQLQKALNHAQVSFDHRFSVHAQCAVHSGYIVALIHLALGQQDQLNATIDDLVDYAMTVRSERLAAMVEAMRADLAIRRGQQRAAIHWAEQALQRTQPAAAHLFFMPQLTVPKVMLAANDPSKRNLLADYLHKLHEQVATIHNTRCLIEVLALEALFFDSINEEQKAFAALERSLSLAGPSGFIRLYVDLGPRMKNLLARLSQRNPSNEFLNHVLAAFQPITLPAINQAMVEPLTYREREVLSLLAKRLTNKEIALQLVIAEGTVKRHTINIYQKLNVNGRRGAVDAARDLGLLQ